ncbi:MAG: fibronectin type III domain-containing protein, partial [Deltaproteobacteria bacterium]|nr:fibronectin type III domain-containing protein [Deltaproteobacteria bacterium]
GNKGDLGFGRHMHMVRKGQRVAMYVDNYPTVEDAVNQQGFFATVAMEFSPAAGAPDDSRYFTKFFAFNAKGNRITQVALDGFGRKNTPAVCFICHGGNVTDPSYSGTGDTGSRFIPFDLDTLGFSERPGYTRADQEDQFKKLNLAVHATFPPGDPVLNPAADPSPTVELIEGWYGGPGFPRATVDPSYTLSGWRGQGEGVDLLYHQVIAKTCRLCHYQREPYRNFSTYAQFWSKMTLIKQRVFEEAAMPASQKGHQNFWLSYPNQANILAKWMGLPKTPSPGRPVARMLLTNHNLLRPGQPIVVDGTDSQFTRTWTFTQVSGPPATLSASGGTLTVLASGAGIVRIQLVTGIDALVSDPVTIDLPVIDAPGAPTAVTAAPLVNGAIVSWTAPTQTGNSPIDHYVVTASPGGATSQSNGTSANVTGLTKGATYTFTVVATNSATISGAASAPSASYRVPTEPDAPTNVVTAQGNAFATVAWTAPAFDGGLPVVGYDVTASPGGAVMSTGSATNVVFTGLTNGTTYTFTVVAKNVVGSGPASSASTPVKPATVPNAPTSVNATSLQNGQVPVSWTAPADNGGDSIIKYTVKASPGPRTATVTCTPPTACATNATVTGLTNGTSYTFTVIATNGVGDSVASSDSNAAIPATLPDAPTGVTAVRGNGSASVTWTAPFDNGTQVTSYVVTSSPGGLTSSVSCTAPAACATATTVSGLTNGTSYTFTVVAKNAAGTGPASSASNAVTPATAPGAPTGVTGTGAQDSQSAVSWTAPASNGGLQVTAYSVTASPGGATAAVTCTAPAACATNAIVTGLTNGTSYSFTVTAANGAGTSTPSSASTAIVPSAVPGAPTNVSASAGVASASVSWTAPASNGAAITSYTVTSSPGGVTATSAGTSVTVTGLTNNTSYTFTVTATNASGTGAASSASNAVVPSSNPNLPTAPQNISATAGTEQAVVTWTAPLSSGSAGAITGYTATSNPGSITGTAGAAGTSTTVTGLTGGVSYTFSVAASNPGGTGGSGTSNSVNVVGRPQPPTGVSATAGDTQVSVSFTAPVNNGGSAITGYTVTVYNASTNAVLASTSTAASPATVTGLTNGTAVYAKVSATNLYVDGSHPALQSAASGSVTPAGKPFAPTGVSGTRGNGQVTVTWTAPGNNGSAITGYTVTASPGGNTSNVTCSPSCATTSTVTGLTNGTSYTFTVTATNVIGTGPASAASAAVIPATAPGAPTGVTAVDQQNAQSDVSWTAPSNTGGLSITGYTVTSSPGGLTASVTCNPPTTTCGTNATVTGLTNGTSYTFTVTATTPAGTSSASSASASVKPGTTPGTPTGVTGSDGSGFIALSWSAPASNGGYSITSYTVSTYFTSNNALAKTAEATGSSATTFNVTSLSNGTSYYFKVAATNALGTGSQSSASSSYVPGAAPSAPSAPTLTALDSTLKVTWSAPANNGHAITSYTVRTQTSGISGTITALYSGVTSPYTIGATLRSCDYNGVVAGTQTQDCNRVYNVSVLATNDLGSSAYSSATGGTPLVSYANDGVSGIWDGEGCTGCHGSSHLPDFDTSPQAHATSMGTAIYTAPSQQLSGYTTMCGSSPCITTSSLAYKTLVKWVAGGNQN